MRKAAVDGRGDERSSESCVNAGIYAIGARILLNSCKRASFSPNFAFYLWFRPKLMRFCRNSCNGVNAERKCCIFQAVG
ncbi:hypothetical protein, partial [Paenibacillus dendritiformis]|uniref:hypothetical protein n=1 Tax=Paenibacillus dendritiformis TaxID=130049 RepID=UPI001EE650FE